MHPARHSSRIALLLLIAVLLFPKLATAQVDVKIIVDGPWAYVADPDAPTTKIFVIAPKAPNHDDAEIYPKPSGHSRTIPPGKYDLAISNVQNCSASSSTHLFALTNIGTPAIRNALGATNQRYAFSLPKPCYYKEVDTKFSKISPAQIQPPVVGDPYTTTMELHYIVSQVTAATLTGTPDQGGKPYNDAVDLKNNYIQFTMSAGLLTQNDEQDCDSTSAASFLATVALFGEKRYVWFPMLNSLGNQIKDFFLDNCQKDNVRQQILQNMKTAAGALEDIEVIERHIADPSKSGKDPLQALRHLSGAVDSLKTADTLPKAPGTPLRPSLGVVTEELKTVETLLLDKSSNAAHVQRGSHEPMRLPLLNTYRYVMFSAAGSADCHGAQVGVNGP